MYDKRITLEIQCDDAIFETLQSRVEMFEAEIQDYMMNYAKSLNYVNTSITVYNRTWVNKLPADRTKKEYDELFKPKIDPITLTNPKLPWD